jgi:hypothetical protein
VDHVVENAGSLTDLHERLAEILRLTPRGPVR